MPFPSDRRPVLRESASESALQTDFELAVDAQDWKEAAWLADTSAEIKRLLAAMGAVPVQLGSDESTEPPVWKSASGIVKWDGGGYAEFVPESDVTSFIYDLDLSALFPGYDEQFNDRFWRSPAPLFHATTREHADGIMKEGIQPQNRTRGISNRSVGNAVFTTMSLGQAELGHYGDVVIAIDTQAMKREGYEPFVAQEPPVVEAEMRGIIAAKLGVEDFDPDVSSDMHEDTVIVYGSIPARYLSLDARYQSLSEAMRPVAWWDNLPVGPVGRPKQIVLKNGSKLRLVAELQKEPYLSLTVSGFIGDEFAGDARFSPNNGVDIADNVYRDSWSALNVYINGPYRRLGVGSALYDFATSLGIKIARSGRYGGKLTADGMHLWQSRATWSRGREKAATIWKKSTRSKRD